MSTRKNFITIYSLIFIISASLVNADEVGWINYYELHGYDGNYIKHVIQTMEKIGGVLYFPTGAYQFTEANILLPDGITILGDGSDKTYFIYGGDGAEEPVSDVVIKTRQWFLKRTQVSGIWDARRKHYQRINKDGFELVIL